MTQYSHIWGTEAADSIAADLAVPMIATRDVVSQAPKARNWQGGGVRELLGQRDLSSSEWRCYACSHMLNSRCSQNDSTWKLIVGDPNGRVLAGRGEKPGWVTLLGYALRLIVWCF